MNDNFNTSNHPDDEQKICIYDKRLLKNALDEDTLKNTSSSTPDAKTQDNWSADSYQRNDKMADDDTVSVFDVSEFILKKVGAMTTMKLQKLVYYCQAWSLVWDEKPLFKEKIEAWANGPVVRELFAFHRGMFRISSVSIGNPDLLNRDQKDTIEAVIEYYGPKSSQWLIDLTHMEEPWKKARIGLPISARSNREISLEDIAEYYSSLPPEN